MKNLISVCSAILLTTTVHGQQTSSPSPAAGSPSPAAAADDMSKYEVWITGEPIMRKKALMFRCDKPVQGNTTGNLVLLGANST